MPARSPLSLIRTCALALTCLVLLAAGSVRAQSVDLTGYVKAEAAYDTRQVLQVREGHLHLYPLPESPAAAADNLLLNAFQSRLKVTGSGTEALGARVSGVVEADFFGVNNDNVNGLRLRHAFVKLDWGTHALLAGQYWSPLFSPSVLAGVQSGNAGAPFQPFARFTQVRYTWTPGRVHVIAALSQQRDAFSDIGGSKSQQQSGLPGAHLHGELHLPGSHVAGVGGYVKTLRPEPTASRFSAWAVQGYGLAKAGPVTARAKATYGNDLTDHLMTGGYVETLSGRYEPLHVASGWVDVEASAGLFAAGLFAGITSNLGARAAVAGEADAAAKTGAAVMLGGVALRSERTRAADIGRVWRLAPRVVLAKDALRLSVEFEVTSARYTGQVGADLRPEPSAADAAVTNARTLVSIFYIF